MIRKLIEAAIVRMTHPNVEREFLPALIRYAQDRGIRVNAYIGLNTFNGGYAREHPESQLLPGKTYAWISAIRRRANICATPCKGLCRWGSMELLLR